jgi:hypothetical protein
MLSGFNHRKNFTCIIIAHIKAKAEQKPPVAAQLSAKIALFIVNAGQKGACGPRTCIKTFFLVSYQHQGGFYAKEKKPYFKDYSFVTIQSNYDVIGRKRGVSYSNIGRGTA